MPAYNETDRCKAFGAYTGCPCPVTLDKGLTSTDKDLPSFTFNKETQNLIDQWMDACDGYQAGPTVGSRFSENWNRSLKLRYGRHANIRCIYDESAPGGGSYCKYP
jgi:hypothetical protein